MKRASNSLLPIALVLFLVAFVGCGHDEQPTAPTTARSFDYRGFDSSGTLVIEGELTIRQHDFGVLDGSWRLRALENSSQLGPQTGTGSLRGESTEQGIVLDLAPDAIDHNVVLRGTMHGNSFEGQWSWITYVGVTSEGTFRATQHNP